MLREVRPPFRGAGRRFVFANFAFVLLAACAAWLSGSSFPHFLCLNVLVRSSCSILHRQCFLDIVIVSHCTRMQQGWQDTMSVPILHECHFFLAYLILAVCPNAEGVRMLCTSRFGYQRTRYYPCSKVTVFDKHPLKSFVPGSYFLFQRERLVPLYVYPF